MIKCTWGGKEGLKAHLDYISAKNKYKSKKQKEHVQCCSRLSSNNQQDMFLSDYEQQLHKKNHALTRQRRISKRFALKIMISWKGCNDEAQAEFLDEFMSRNFKGCLWTWAQHKTLDERRSHFHLVICPRRNDGTIVSFSKRDIRKLQNEYLMLSNKHQLATGWDISNMKDMKKRKKHVKRSETRLNTSSRVTPAKSPQRRF